MSGYCYYWKSHMLKCNLFSIFIHGGVFIGAYKKMLQTVKENELEKFLFCSI